MLLLVVALQMSLFLKEPKKSDLTQRQGDKRCKAENRTEIHLLATLDF